MLVRLTPSQMSLIKQYTQRAEDVLFLGIDQNDRPVIQLIGQGFKDPFALRGYATHRGTVTAEPALPLRMFNDYELDHIDVKHYSLLMDLYRG